MTFPNVFKRFCLLGAVLTLLALSACAASDNRITLGYLPSMGGEDLHGDVAVGSFLDTRAEHMLGHNEKFDFRPDGQDVDQWLRSSLMQELKARGCRVYSSDDLNAPKVVITGSVSKVNLVANGMNHALDLEFTLILNRDGDMVFKKTYAGRWERMIALPSREKSEEMIAVCLHELLAKAVTELASKF